MKKVAKWVLIIVSMAIGGAFLLVAFSFVMLVNAWSNGVKPDFEGYQPKMSLAGWDITETAVQKGAANGKVTPSYRQTYSSGVILTQFKSSESVELIACNNQERLSTNAPVLHYTYKCQSRTTRHGSGYAITKVFLDGDLDQVELRAQIRGTKMYLHIPDKAQVEVADFTGWQEYFDSMEPVDLNSNELSDSIDRIIKFLTYQGQIALLLVFCYGVGMYKSKSGFTIVELLIVIVVIAILAAISMVAFQGIQRRAAEARMDAQLAQVRKEIEQDYILNGKWPFEDAVRAACPGVTSGSCSGSGFHIASYIMGTKQAASTGWCTSVSTPPNAILQADGTIL